MNPNRRHETIPRKGAPYSKRRWHGIHIDYRWLSEPAFAQSDALRIANSFNQLGISSSGKVVALPLPGDTRFIVASTAGQGDFRSKADLFVAGFLAGRAH